MKRILLVAVLAIASVMSSFAQEEESVNEFDGKRIVQFSGLVVEGDSMLAIPGVSIFMPNSGRGATTNLLGYFSLPVLEGDSVVVAAVGFKRQYIQIPLLDSTDQYSIVIRMQMDTAMFPLVEIDLFPSEKVFKKAFLAMEVDQESYSNMQTNLNDAIMRRMLATQEVGGNLNHKWFMDQQINAMQDRYVATSLPLLDPFAWARFFKDLKDEKEKKEQQKKDRENDAGY